ASRDRGRAAVLAGGAVQPPRPLHGCALRTLGRVLPRLPRRVRGPRRRRRRARDPREHAADGRRSCTVASIRGRMRIGADVGGTFTDVLALDGDGRVRVPKVLSTPPDYDRAVVDAVRELAGPKLEAIVHGTTVATNAVLERRGARTALVTTEGFRDVLELRRMRMPHLYDYFWTKPEPLVPRHLRFEIAERMTVSGEVLTIMQSSGGVMSAADAERRPVYALESGPAAGVVASAALARSLGHENVITFDMGGTTAKASLIEGGAVSRSMEYEVGAALSSGSRLLRGSGELIRIPTIDIAEVGAGGGSIAFVDEAGGLHVGPRSAGAEPGPACYGRGAEEATVTDANVLLGYIPTGPLASGDLAVEKDLAAHALARLGGALDLSALEAACGIHELANAAMMRALRAVSTEKGRDPSDFVLLAYGGSGPVHAAALAAELGVKTAIVPALAGLFSAAGLLFARTERHDVRFCKVSARDGDA